MDERQRSYEIALLTSEEIRRLFGKIGTSQNPRGMILAAYRNAIRSLRGRVGNQALMDDALISLRLAVLESLTDVLRAGVEVGMKQAEMELKLWAIRPAGIAQDIADAASAITNIVDSQIQAAWAMKRMGAEEAILIGDAKRLGLLNPTPVTRESARWLTMSVNSAYASIVKQSLQQSGDAGNFDKQAVAAIDGKTTDCCLRVHGQTVPMDGMFKLTGEPRFADEMAAPGFHWWCRTAMVLVPASRKKDQLTIEMEEAATNEIKAREETGIREEIHPSHARSGRAK